MKRSVGIILVALACAVATTAEIGAVPGQKATSKKATERAAIEKTLLADEQKLNDAVMKGDVTTFKTLVDADAWSGDGNGFVSATEFEKQLKAGAAKITETKMTGQKVLWIDSDNAVLTYTWTGKGTYMNKPVPSPVYASTLWTNHKGKWVAAFHQETPAMPASGK